ncbi:rab3 GTPase-activating protein non-catalytic subunit-like isoform X3 [Dysidea avara]
MEAVLISYGRIVEGPRKSLSHMSSKDAGNQVFSFIEQPETMISLSPNHELLAVVSGNNASFYVQKKFAKESVGGVSEYSEYILNWDGMLHIVKDWSDERPTPTAIECISFCSGKSDEFSVVAVGFSDGFLRCYTQDGRPLLSQQLHKSEITSLSYTSPIKLSSKTIHQAELLAVCNNVLIVIDGPSLTATILSCIDKDISREQDQLETMSDLVYQKWKLDKQQNTANITCISKTTPSLFDSLVETSLIGKYDMPVKGTTPLGATKVISTGQQPMLGFYQITKDSGPPIMSEMLSAVTNKLTSAVMTRVNLGGWLGWGSGSQDSQVAKQVPIQPTSSLPMSCNLHDQSRAVEDITISPCGRLAAAVDSFGRVLLVDTQRMLITKMWKGYRGAQCGWIVVNECNSSESTARQALCLCVYLSKRGLLELWPVQRGPKVASFNTGKGCRLLHTSRVVFNHSDLLNKATMLLLTPNGQLITVSVPLHLLLRTDSTMSRDLHLLTTLPQLIAKGDSSDILEIILTMLSLSVIDKAIHMLTCAEMLNSVKVYLIVKILDSVMSRLPSEHQKCLAGCGIRDYLERIKQLVQFFGQIDEMFHKEAIHSLKPRISVEDIEDCSSVSKQMACNLTFCINEYFLKYPLTPIQCGMLALDKFLKCFKLKEELTQSVNLSLESEEKCIPSMETPVQVSVKKLSSESLSFLGLTIFKGCLSIQASDDEIKSFLISSGIDFHILLEVANAAVLSGKLAAHGEPYTTFCYIAKLLKVLIPLQDSSQLDNIFEQCSKATLSGQALLLALHTINYTTETDLKEKDLSSSDGWETVSIVKEQWFMLVNQLHTLTLLKLLNNNDSGISTIPPLPKISSKGGATSLASLHPITVKETVSVAVVQQYGYSIITSVVAHWLVTNRIQPKEFDIVQLTSEAAVKWQSYLLRLCNELQFTLSREKLLTYMIWAIICSYNEAQDSSLLKLSSSCLESLESSIMWKGCAIMLWYGLFQEQILTSFQQLRKLSPSCTPHFNDKVSFARVTLHVLVQNNTSKISPIALSSQAYSDVWNLDQSDEMEMTLYHSFKHNQLVSLTDLILNSPKVNTRCAQLHYLTVLIVDIALTFNLFPLRVFTMLGSQAKDCLGEELHIDIGQLEEKVKRSGTLERTQKQFIVKALVAIITQQDVAEPTQCVATSDGANPLCTWIQCCVHLSSLMGISEQWCWNKYVYLLYAAGLYDKGDQEFLSLSDKSMMTEELLLLSGWKINKLMSQMEASEMASYIAHLSPNGLQWIKKQAGNIQVPTHFPLSKYTWHNVLSLLHTISGHFESTTTSSDMISQLISFVQYCTTR